MQETNWHEIYSTLSPKVLGICRRYIKDIATAEDIVQDAFIIAIQKEHELKNKEAINGWLSRIVINRAINYLKKESIVNYTDANSIEFIDETTEMNIIAIDKKSAILASDFSHEDLLEAIDSLSENHKSVFNLYIIDEFSHIQISKLLNISVGTSKSSLSRARKNIQQFLIYRRVLQQVHFNQLLLFYYSYIRDRCLIITSTLIDTQSGWIISPMNCANSSSPSSGNNVLAVDTRG